MRKPPQVALLCAGNLKDSAVTRFRGLAARLGPVKSSSLRLASRFANILRAGHPVSDYGAFRDCPVLLIAAPDARAVEAIRDLSDAGLDWSGKSVVLCSAALESEELNALAARGASTASLCEAAGFEGRLFLAEGDRAAVKQVRPLVAGHGSKLLALSPGHKKFYLSAAACNGPLFLSLLWCSAECLKLAGLGTADAAGMLQIQTERTIRSFLKGNRKPGPPPGDLERQIAALRARHPQLGEFFQQNAKLAAWFSEHV